MVVETPPQALGMFDDRWWQWIVDFGQCAERVAGVWGRLRATAGLGTSHPIIVVIFFA
jgi:hypothetical protein